MVLAEKVPLAPGDAVVLLWMSCGCLLEAQHRLLNRVLGHRPHQQRHSERSMNSESGRPGGRFTLASTCILGHLTTPGLGDARLNHGLGETGIDL